MEGVRKVVCTTRAARIRHNQGAQPKVVVRSARHNLLAEVGGAIPAWHNQNLVVQICLMDFLIQYNTLFALVYHFLLHFTFCDILGKIREIQEML